MVDDSGKSFPFRGISDEAFDSGGRGLQIHHSTILRLLQK